MKYFWLILGIINFITFSATWIKTGVFDNGVFAIALASLAFCEIDSLKEKINQMKS
jgi:hypothetical protein